MSSIVFFQSHPLAFLLCAGLFGMMVGSFLNVVAYRLPKMLERDWRREARVMLDLPPGEGDDGEKLGLLLPASRCPGCGHRIGALENIPVLSYLFLHGRCAQCHTAISIRYPVIELIAGLSTALVAWRFGVSPQAAAAALLGWALIALSAIDLDCHLLPDDITLPFLWLGLAINLRHLFTDLPSAVMGAMCGYLALWTVYKAFKLLTGKEGMGYGDFKLLALLGAWLGWKMLPVVILLSSVCGAVVGVAIIALNRAERSAPIPFGPYLAAAGFIALLWGTQLTDAYFTWALAR